MTTTDYLDAAEQRVLAVLGDHHGRARAIRVPDLAALVGVGPREVQAIVHRLRIEHGAPIASTAARPAGYYLVETSEEVEQFVREQRRKAIGTLAAIAAVRRVALPELLGQLAIETDVGARHASPLGAGEACLAPTGRIAA